MIPRNRISPGNVARLRSLAGRAQVAPITSKLVGMEPYTLWMGPP